MSVNIECATILQAITGGTRVPLEVRSTHSVLADENAKISSSDMSAVTPSVLPSYSYADLSELQHKDEALKEVWSRWDCKWDPGEGFPNIEFPSNEIKSWLHEWLRIVERHDVLYRLVEDPGLGQVGQLLVPRCLRAVIVDASHDKWGHQGVGRTLSFIKRRCYWPGMSSDVREHIRNCYHCTVTKAQTPTVRTPMRHLLAFRPLERLAIDFLKLDRGHGNYEDVLVMTDSFTNFAVATPCNDQTAVTVACVLMCTTVYQHKSIRVGEPILKVVWYGSCAHCTAFRKREQPLTMPRATDRPKGSIKHCVIL